MAVAAVVLVLGLVVTAIAALPAIVLLDPVLTAVLLHASPYFTWRVAQLLPFAVYVAGAWGLLRKDGPSQRWRQNVTLAAVACLLFASVSGFWPLVDRLTKTKADGVLGIPYTRNVDVRTTWGAAALGKLSALFTAEARYPVVAGDLETTYELAGVFPVAVMAAPVRHAPFAIEAVDGAQRRQETSILLDPATSSEQRREILSRRRVSFVALPPRRGNVGVGSLEALRRETSLLEPVLDTPSLVVFRVK
jgi:hypothetical protein